MSWLRWWSGTVNDPKWRIVAARAGCRAGDCVAVWAYLLEIAKDGDGDVSAVDAEECSVVLGYEIETIERIIKAMRDKSLISGDRIAAWEKRQPKREDDSRVRVAAFRARQAEEKSVTDQRIDACNDHVTQCNAPETETETEKNTSSLRSDVERASAPDQRKPEKRASRFPKDFEPNETGLSAARRAGIPEQAIPKEIDRFRDYHCAKGSKMLDWQAAWRTWCGNYRPQPSAGPSLPPPRRGAVLDVLNRIANDAPDNTPIASRPSLGFSKSG